MPYEKYFDSKCWDIAEHFLNQEDIPDKRSKDEALNRLSEAIQQTVEDFIKFDLPLIIKNYRKK